MPALLRASSRELENNCSFVRIFAIAARTYSKFASNLRRAIDCRQSAMI